MVFCFVAVKKTKEKLVCFPVLLGRMVRGLSQRLALVNGSTPLNEGTLSFTIVLAGKPDFLAGNTCAIQKKIFCQISANGSFMDNFRVENSVNYRNVHLRVLY
jgi:hypothetical protein